MSQVRREWLMEDNQQSLPRSPPTTPTFTHTLHPTNSMGHTRHTPEGVSLMSHLVAVSSFKFGLCPMRRDLSCGLSAAPWGLTTKVLSASFTHTHTHPTDSGRIETNRWQFKTPMRKREDGKTQQPLVHSNDPSSPPRTE